MEAIMDKRLKEAKDKYEAQFTCINGIGSCHPDFDPYYFGADAKQASRVTEECYAAIVANDIARVYETIEQGADVHFVFGPSYRCEEGYSLLMVAAHRGRLECARALLRGGADPNLVNFGGDMAIFWAIDGGPEMIKLFHQHGAQLDKRSPKNWTPLSYAIAKGKYGAVEEHGIYPEDVLRYFGATEVGTGPIALGERSPRNSYDPSAADFMRERGSYQRVMAHPG